MSTLGKIFQENVFSIARYVGKFIQQLRRSASDPAPQATALTEYSSKEMTS
jgi:hypothetical protein